MSWLLSSLSFRLLVLTVFFVMVAEVLIFSPSVALFRQAYLVERLGAAHLAALTIEATPNGKVAPELALRALSYVGAYQLQVTEDGEMKQELRRDNLPSAVARYDLRDMRFMTLVFDAFVTIAHTENRVIDVIGRSPKMASVVSTIRMDEAPLRTAMLEYSWRIFRLSILISLIAAALVFVSLQWLLVAPIQRLTASMVAFRKAPEDCGRDVIDAGRRDEIGVAMRELGTMKTGLRRALHQQTRLAALGKAMANVNHDLRNILTSATLISDRLSDSNDPDVRKVAPVLMRAIDRAINLCTETLNFASDKPSLSLRRFPISALVNDLGDAYQVGLTPPMTIGLKGDADICVKADYNQLYRVFENLAGNAHAAKASAFSVSVSVGAGGTVDMLFEDNGHGMSDIAQGSLFQPSSFSSSTKGFGLGLAISADIMRAHGGGIALKTSSPKGSVFAGFLPAAALMSNAERSV